MTTYRQRRIFKQLWPCMTVTLSEPFYPDPTLPPRAARKKLRDEVYGFMCRVSSAPGNYAYYEYREGSLEEAKAEPELNLTKTIPEKERI